MVNLWLLLGRAVSIIREISDLKRFHKARYGVEPTKITLGQMEWKWLQDELLGMSLLRDGDMEGKGQYIDGMEISLSQKFQCIEVN